MNSVKRAKWEHWILPWWNIVSYMDDVFFFCVCWRLGFLTHFFFIIRRNFSFQKSALWPHLFYFYFFILYLTKNEPPCSFAVLPVFPFILASGIFGLALCFAGNLIAFYHCSTSVFFYTEVFMLLSTHAVILGAVMWSWKWEQWWFSPTVHKVHCIDAFYCFSRSRKKPISHCLVCMMSPA